MRLLKNQSPIAIRNGGEVSYKIERQCPYSRRSHFSKIYSDLDKRTKTDIGGEESDNHFYLVMAIAELCRRTTFLSFKDAIEVTHIIVTTLKTDFSNCFGGVNQHPCGITQAYVNDVIT